MGLTPIRNFFLKYENVRWVPNMLERFMANTVVARMYNVHVDTLPWQKLGNNKPTVYRGKVEILRLIVAACSRLL